MLKLPKISVVTITYGHQDYILDTLKGVLMQEYNGEIEFIIANDNSPDETHRVVTEFLNTNSIPPRFEIKYTKHEKNLGMMPNFIWALQQANGKYIALCEGDDYWIDPLKIQKQVDFMEDNINILACGTYFSVKTDGDMIKNKVLDFNIKYFHHYDIITNNRISTLTSMYRAPLNLPNYIDKCKFGDMSILLYITSKGGSIALLPFISAVYRINNQGVFSGTTVFQNIKNGFNDKILFLENNPIKFKFLYVSVVLYLKRLFVNSLRVVLKRPNTDVKISFYYTKMIAKMTFIYLKKVS